MEYRSNIFEYKSFVSNQLIEQAKMERYIKECVLIGESKNTIKNIDILNESVTDKIKEAFKKIMETIGKMWGKFLEAMNNLISNNRSYLEKYKDIILKKKLRNDATYKMYNYSEGLNRMIQTPVPAFNYESMKDILDDQDKFISSNQYLSKCKSKDSDSAFIDQCKAYFRGGADTTDIAATKLNMTDIFNYCYNYESKMKPLLEKDLNQIKAAANDAADTIDKAEREKNSQPTAESYIHGEKYYSYVYEDYIEELDISYGDNKSTGGGDETNAAKNMKNIDGESPEKDAQNTALKKDESSYDEKIKRIQTYLNVCGGLLAAKQTVAEAMFKDYMQIIKAHVRGNVGTSKKDTSNDKVADAGTNYKNIVDKAFGKPKE